MTRQSTRDGCPLLATCPDAAIFKSRPPQDGAPGWQDFSQVPKPYVITAVTISDILSA